MALLKKIQAASLVETIIASVIILIGFMIGSMSLNNIFHSTIINDDTSFKARIQELNYLSAHEKLTLPFYEETDMWNVQIRLIDGKTQLEALNKKNGNSITKLVFEK